MGRRGGVATRDEPTGAIRNNTGMDGQNRCRRTDLLRYLVESNRIEPDDSGFGVAN